MKTAKLTIQRAARCLALAGALALAVSAAHAAAPATDVVYRSMQSPYPSTTPFDNSSVAWHNFFANATDTYGFSAHSVNMGTAPLGSFQGGGQTLTMPVFNSDITLSISSNATMWARLETGNQPYAFTDVGSNTRSLHVAALGQAAQDVTLLTINFSRPVQGFAFLGAGISDYAGYSGSWPSQRIQLDNGPMYDLVANPMTVSNPSRMSFGVLAAQPFSSLRLILPAGSDNDNAALTSLLVAYSPAPTAPVPEPGTWALLAAGLAVVTRVSRQGALRSRSGH
jgi:hypothetical protein